MDIESASSDLHKQRGDIFEDKPAYYAEPVLFDAWKRFVKQPRYIVWQRDQDFERELQ